MADGVTEIGEGTKITGTIEAEQDLVVRGRIEGNIRMAETLRIEPGGVVAADVEVKDCIVAGAVVGNVTASDALHITESGKMIGDIKAPRFILLAGGAYRGNVDMGDIETGKPRPKRGTMPETSGRAMKKESAQKRKRP